jgi:hypothetical protein
VNPAELVFGAALVAVLLGVGGFYGWRQVRRLRGPDKGAVAFPGEERYFRTQAWRRLVCSGLMVLLAGLLVGSYFLEDPADVEAAYLFALYWIGVFLVFLAILALAVADWWATRNFTLRQLQQLEDRHQDLIARAARLRGRRSDIN